MNDIKKYSKELRLAYTTRNIKELIDEAEIKDQGYVDFIHSILQKESDHRNEQGKVNRIRLAEFPYKKYLEDLKIEHLPEDARRKLKQLETLEFIENSQNIILAGNPGTGKTHLAIGLGIKACHAGHKVLFTTVPMLINRLKEHRAARSLLLLERQFERYDLIIADELGYISFDKEGSELLFTHLSLRAERN
ncbi:MAG TPA: AAA family ATPase [Clostridiales bacterium]|nr:AAA family ATPase [Clostridiales bacterium]